MTPHPGVLTMSPGQAEREGERVALDGVVLDVAALPAVLAGPVLRRLTRTQVSVWVALSRGSDVTLRLRVTGQPGTEVAAATVSPVRVGSNLWVAVLTGGPPGGGTFAADTLYEYRLSSAGWPAEPNWGALAIGTGWPAFPGPPDDVADLVVLHTSCRKPHELTVDESGPSRAGVRCSRVGDWPELSYRS